MDPVRCLFLVPVSFVPVRHMPIRQNVGAPQERAIRAAGGYGYCPY